MLSQQEVVVPQIEVQVPTPPPPPPIPEAPALPGVTPNVRAVLEAKEQQREVLGEQLSRLLNRRENLLEEMQDPMTSGAERNVLQEHLVAVNARIIDMEHQIQRADGEWAAAAAVPGAAEPPMRTRDSGPPEEMLILGTIFTGIAICIVAAAWARRIVKGGGKMIAQIPAAFENRFTRLEQSLDAVAIEVERISEGQRFLTRVFGEQNPRAVGAGPMQPVEARSAEGVRESYREG